MSDRPILFSAPMVRALLEGRKTQTRRVAKVRKGLKLQELIDHGERREGGIIHVTRDMLAPPRFAPGDRLWVKETFAEVGTCDPGWLIFRATYEDCCRRFRFDNPPPESEVGWKPSIFMPRRLSRLTLLVTDVRVERLQDISEADARAEGCPVTWDGKPYDPPPPEVDSWQGYGRASYCLLWNQINGPGAWQANPWVVAVSFDVRKGNIDAVDGGSHHADAGRAGVERLGAGDGADGAGSSPAARK